MDNVKHTQSTTEQERGKVIHLSNGMSYSGRLIAYPDHVNGPSRGNWRLFWEDPDNDGCGVNDDSHVTGQPFFRTMRDAIAHGRAKYGVTAERAPW